jgi:hypothetical protein
MFLMTDPTADDQSAVFQLGELSLRCARTCSCGSDQLRCVEAAIGVAKEDAEDALLCLRQQGNGLNSPPACRRTRTAWS